MGWVEDALSQRSVMDPDQRSPIQEWLRGLAHSGLSTGAGLADMASMAIPGRPIGASLLAERLDRFMGDPNAPGAPAAYSGGGLLGDMAQIVTPAGLLRKVGNLPSSLASRNVKIGAPEPRPQRPFEYDYPGSSGTPGSPLQFDIEGRPLTAAIVAGRRRVGDADAGLLGSDPRDASTLLGATSREATSRELGRDIGQYKSGADAQGNRTREILIRKGLPAETVDRVQRHELGHLIEDLVYGKQIEAKGLQSELTQVYHELNGQGRFNAGRQWSPVQDGYKGADIQREYMAEALRAYMTDPNYLKSVAPKTAAAIREAVNANPNLNRVIQFNQMGGAGVGLGITGGGLLGMPPDDTR